jgi:hypothetical protein
VSVTEVADALHAPAGLYLERVLSDRMIVVMGMTETGRVIAVVVDRIAGTVTYKIIGPVAGRTALTGSGRRTVRGGGEEGTTMRTDPKFEDMTGPELLAYLYSTTDHSAFVQRIRRGQTSVDESVEPATRLTAVRLPAEMIDRLDELSAGDRQGRS